MRVRGESKLEAPGGYSIAADDTKLSLGLLMATHDWLWADQEKLTFLPECGLWREQGRVLFVADLHLGKAEVFQAHGIPLPSDGDQGTLNPLLDLCHQQQPNRLVVLGDLIHAQIGLTPSLRQTLRAFPDLCGCEVILIGGNHDAGSWLEGLPQQASQRLGSLWLSHIPERVPEPGLLNVCGHLHPMARLQSRSDRLRMPCFAFDPDGPRLVIPAFGQLTGGHDCGERYQQWLVADGAIVPWFAQLPKNRGRRVA